MGNIHNKHIFDTKQIVFQFNQYIKNIVTTCTFCNRNFSCNKCLFRIDGIQGKKPQCNKILNKEQFKRMLDSIIGTYKRHPELYRMIMKRTTFA